MNSTGEWSAAPLVALDLEGSGAQDRDHEAILEIADVADEVGMGSGTSRWALPWSSDPIPQVAGASKRSGAQYEGVSGWLFAGVDPDAFQAGVLAYHLGAMLDAEAAVLETGSR
jgi:hypothetical protein